MILNRIKNYESRIMVKTIIFLTLFVIHNLLFIIPAFAQTASLSLDPAQSTATKGCNFSVKVNVDTAGVESDGTDAILIYDPSRFLGQSITNGSIYPDFPGSSIDNAAGRILITGLASVETPFVGKGLLATVNFLVSSNAPTGTTQITFDFNPQNKAETRDSNIVQRGTVADVLDSVTNGVYTVQTGSCNAPASPSPTPGVLAPVTPPTTSLPQTGGTYNPATPSGGFFPPKTLPDGGTPQFTYTLAIIGGVLTVLGIIGIALL